MSAVSQLRRYVVTATRPVAVSDPTRLARELEFAGVTD